MVEEARLEQLDAGFTPVTEGWFVVNVREGAWVTNDVLGSACTFEGEGTPPFGEVGYTLGVLQPGGRALSITASRTRRTSSSWRESACC
jgi:hypothetical protein